MKRGSLYWINLEPSIPPEFGKVRPGLIISNSEQNILLPTVIIIPISSQSPEIWPLRLGFKMAKNKESFLVLPGIRQVNKTRLHEMVGLAPESLMQRLDDALLAYLND